MHDSVHGAHMRVAADPDGSTPFGVERQTLRNLEESTQFSRREAKGVHMTVRCVVHVPESMRYLRCNNCR